MAGSLTGYYGRAKYGLSSVRGEDLEDMGKDYLAVAVTGAGIGMASTMIGGLDKPILGVPVPLDGVASLALGYGSLVTRGDVSKMLKVASIAAGGSAAVRTFEAFFKKGFGVHGELEDLGSQGLPGYRGAFGPTFAFGQSAQDRLVESAKYL
jgi:hypothetical protein